MISWDEGLAWVERTLNIAPATSAKITITLAVFLILGWLRAGLARVATNRIEDADRRYAVLKGIGVSYTVILLIVLARVWLIASGMGTYLGILSAGLAIALQEPILNMAGWLFIQMRRPYRVGDRVEIGKVRGDVIDVRVFTTTLIEVGNWVEADQSTGRIVHIPNGWVFRHAVSNYTEGFPYIWNEIPVTVTFESDWRQAKTILLAIAEKHSSHLTELARVAIRQGTSKYRLHYPTLSASVWTSVADHGVTLTIRALTEARQRRTVTSVMWEEVLDAFSEVKPPIEFAYPTIRQFRRWVEEEGALDDD
ncbi:mechanosensitive ion channel family protein [bacterium]|nr:mechanosensitive ion channel family protein [bacterium]